ncbi:MAG: glycosyltransferase [Lachnospiraceae bacterium]|nr:glycosyltransferase [Lachnospiraceae bacterium]
MVTVITVCFNEKKGIRPTMNSVLAQDYRDFEYIIKDGGSVDGTREIIESYRKRFARKGISLRLVSGPDRGIYDAMNLAVREAKGDWINFMNAGDRFYGPNVLSQIFTCNKEGGCAQKAGKHKGEADRQAADSEEAVDLIYGDTAEEEFGELHYFRKCPEMIEERMPFSHQSVFVRREHLIAHPFRLRYPIAADYDFLLTLHKEGKVFADTGVLVAVVTKTGKSSLRLKDTYLESIRVRRSHGITVPGGGELRKKLLWMDIKQFGMDYFPAPLKYMIRKVQRRLRGQKRVE